MTTQLNLFNQPTLNVLRTVKGRMSFAFSLINKEKHMSREDVCDAMNDLAERYGVCLVGGRGRKLAPATLDKWLNPEEKEHFPSIKALPIFCAVVNSVEPLQAMVEPLGWQIIGEQDVRLLAWAKHYFQARKIRVNMKKLEAEL